MSASSQDQHETKKHYFTPTIASKYANTIFSSPLYTKWISSLIHHWLKLRPGHVVVDMGCGPGLESGEILEKMNNQIHVIGVDPSQAMLDVFRDAVGPNPNVETVCMDAVTFSQSSRYSSYDRIFLKGMIHLLTHEERLVAFEGFYKQLVPKNGKLLIIISLDVAQLFPFDERTKRLFGKPADVNTWIDELKIAGFKQVHQETSTFEFPPDTVSAEDWIYIIKNRLFTIFSEESMNEKQMADLIDHVKRQYESPSTFQTKNRETLIICCVE